MLSLDRAVARNATAGDRMPSPWASLNTYASPRRGQVTMVYGPAGSCKSMFALNYVLGLSVPTLYISPDTDQHDMALRCVEIFEGYTSDVAEDAIRLGAIDLAVTLAPLNDWLRFAFDAAPTVDDVDLELMAFEEQFGAPPEVLVVDTLSDVHANDEDEYRGYRKTMAALHIFARTTNALVLVLHHTTGEYDGNVSPAPRRAINGKLSKVPELVLSLARNEAHLGAAIVKQRSGFQDPEARSPIWLSVDPARATIQDRADVVSSYYE